MHEEMLEMARARVLLNKVATFERATPTDLNVIIQRAFELAEARNEDLAEIGSQFYSRMMRKISREDQFKTEKKINMKDPSMEVFS